MTLKIALLKSGEDVIADIKEIVDDEKKSTIAYMFDHPYIVKLIEKTEVFLQEEITKQLGYDIYFSPWAPLSQDKQFPIPMDWVVTIYEPHEDVKFSYVKKMEEQNESCNS